jgi:hypothetical protein
MAVVGDERGEVAIPWNIRMHRLGIEVMVHRRDSLRLVEIGWSPRGWASMADALVIGIVREKTTGPSDTTGLNAPPDIAPTAKAPATVVNPVSSAHRTT